MTKKTPDLSALEQQTDPNDGSQYVAVVRELLAFTERLDQEVFLSPVLRAHLRPGFKFRDGQQFTCCFDLESQQHRGRLLSATVPDRGYPVVLKFAGMQVEAGDEAALLQLLYEVVPADENVQSQVRALRALTEVPPEG